MESKDFAPCTPCVPRAAFGPRMGLTALLLLGGCTDVVVNQQPTATADKSCHTISTVSTSQDAANKQMDRIKALEGHIEELDGHITTIGGIQRAIQSMATKISTTKEPASDINLGWSVYNLLTVLNGIDYNLGEQLGDNAQTYLENKFKSNPTQAINELRQKLPDTNIKTTVLAALELLVEATNANKASKKLEEVQPLYLADIVAKIEQVRAELIADLTAEQTALLAEMKRQEIDACVATRVAGL